MKNLNSVILEGTIVEVNNDENVKIVIHSNNDNFRAEASGKLGAYVLHYGKIGREVRIVGHLETDEKGVFIKIEHIEFRPVKKEAEK